MGRSCALVLLLGACSFSTSLSGVTADSDPGTIGGEQQIDAPNTTSCGGPTFRSASSAFNSTDTTVTVATPGGAQVNDLMLAIVLYQSDSDESVGTVTAPTGWTLVRRDAHGGNGEIGQSVFSKPVAVGDALHAFTSGPSKRFIAIIHAYAGVDTSMPVAMHQGRVNTTSSSISTPTMAVATCHMIVGAFGTRSLSTLTGPAALTERMELMNNSDATLAIVTADASMTGSTGSLTAMASQSGLSLGQLIALRAP